MVTKVQYPLVAGDKGTINDSITRVSPTLALLAGWLVPGAGHLLLGKWIRALLLAASILGMFAIGIALQGKIYSPNTGEPLGANRRTLVVNNTVFHDPSHLSAIKLSIMPSP